MDLGYLPRSQVNSTLFRNPIELCMIDYCKKTWPTWDATGNGSCASNFSNAVESEYSW